MSAYSMLEYWLADAAASLPASPSLCFPALQLQTFDVLIMRERNARLNLVYAQYILLKVRRLTSIEASSWGGGSEMYLLSGSSAKVK